MPSFRKRPPAQPNVPPADYEAEVLPGLEPFAEAELKRTPGVRRVGRTADRGVLSFSYIGDAARLSELRTVTAVYALLHFAVPRPKALLGHEHLTRLTGAIAALQRRQTFGGFRIGAAGSGSAVFARFAAALSAQTGLEHLPEEGELLVRVRPSQRQGWEVLLRLTPRPLSARAWRVCNLTGGLNATLAAAMLELAQVKPHDRVFNPFCGSGTLLIEQGLQAAPAQLLGCDLDPAALACSAKNAAAAGVTGAEFLEVDATATGLAAGSVDVIVADPPWGDAVGSHSANDGLYSALLMEMGRLAAPGARFVLLTHELKLFERVLAAQHVWQVAENVQVFHGGHNPRAYLLIQT